MQIFLHILLLIAGLILVIKGGDLFVDSSIYIAKKFKIPSIIIGATIVSVATTLPELIVSTIAAAQGSFDLAVGNSAGSIICNTALVCGLSIAIVPVALKEKSSPFKYLLLLGAGVLLLICSLDYTITWYESAIFLVLFIVYMTYNLLDAKKQMKADNFKAEVTIEESKKDERELKTKDETNEKSTKKVEANKSTEEELKPRKMWLVTLLFILGAGMIAGGAFALVEGATFLASAMGISEAFIGLTIVAIGTSLPELITTITSIKKKDTALGYGNIVGANTINVTLIMGVCGVISGKNGLPLSKYTLLVTIPLVIVLTCVFVLPLMIKNKSFRWQGIALLGLYLAYFVFLLIMTLLGIAL